MENEKVYAMSLTKVCCSNGQRCTYAEKIKRLENTLTEIGLQPVFSYYIFISKWKGN